MSCNWFGINFIEQVKLEIKKDKQGIVWVQGSHVAPIASAEMLLDVFRQGLHSRHTGSTQMNDRSSRSHLIVGINIECVSRLHGTVTHGKVSHSLPIPIF